MDEQLRRRPDQPAPGANTLPDAIQATFDRLGGPGGLLGFPTTPELPTADRIGAFRHYAAGSIYWSPASGAHEVHGAIRAEWAALGWETGFLRYPVTDELPTPDRVGRFNYFQGGGVYWTPATGPHEVHGAILAKWASLGWESGSLRYPVTDELPTPDRVGRFNYFQGGGVYWTPATRPARRERRHPGQVGSAGLGAQLPRLPGERPLRRTRRGPQRLPARLARL